MHQALHSLSLTGARSVRPQNLKSIDAARLRTRSSSSRILGEEAVNPSGWPLLLTHNLRIQFSAWRHEPDA